MQATATVYQGEDRGYYISTLIGKNGANVPGREILSRTEEVKGSNSIQVLEEAVFQQAIDRKIPLND